MEGLKALVWWSEAKRRNLVTNKPDCGTCMKNLSEQARQIDGCGLLPPPAENLRGFSGLWNGGSLPNYRGPEITVCPGYSTSLPEVVEVFRAWRHWSKGAVQFDNWIESPLALAVETFDSCVSEFEGWRMTDEDKGGGRPKGGG